jgi:undecaprenyl-diphosphatase
VALHAGATAAWLLAPGSGGRETLADLRRSIRRPAFLTLAVAPPAAAGLLLEEPIERRLGTPATIALGLAAGSLAMLAADRRQPTRSLDGAGAADGAALGLAQASALFPGVSRSGATIAAARIRGWGRGDSRRVANLVGLPVIAGAAMLKGMRMRQTPPKPRERAAMAVGAGASFGSAWLVAPLLGRLEEGPLTPYAAYRLGLALAIASRLRR